MQQGKCHLRDLPPTIPGLAQAVGARARLPERGALARVSQRLPLELGDPIALGIGESPLEAATRTLAEREPHDQWTVMRGEMRARIPSTE